MCIAKSQLNCPLDQFEYNGACISICPSGFYPHVLTQFCRACSFECETCIDLNKCLTCRNGLIMDQNTQECYSCPNGC